MKKLLDEEFFHFGTDRIYKELWLNIQMDQIYKTYTKPYGGLWCSHQNNYVLSDWIGYKIDNDEFYQKEFLDFLGSLLIKFKTASKTLIIEDKNDYNNLKNSGFIKKLEEPVNLNKWYCQQYIDELIDYEKVSEFFDLLYINNTANKNLSNFSIRTMLALNPNCIEYYKPVIANYNEYKIISIGEKTFIEEPNKDFYLFKEFVNSLFKEITATSYEEYINKLKKMKNDIESKLNSEISNLNFKFPHDINLSHLINTIVRNIYREKYMEEQKRLIKK